MRVKYFADTDNTPIEFTDKAVRKTKEISGNIYIDADGKDKIVSMTIEHAKDNAGFWEFSYQEMSRQTAWKGRATMPLRRCLYLVRLMGNVRRHQEGLKNGI